jgi:hypothetical protein
MVRACPELALPAWAWRRPLDRTAARSCRVIKLTHFVVSEHPDLGQAASVLSRFSAVGAHSACVITAGLD